MPCSRRLLSPLQGAYRNLAAPLADATSYLANAFAAPPDLDLHPKASWSGLVRAR
jgi:hypothetical protein